jgi:hypothetical protein
MVPGIALTPREAALWKSAIHLPLTQDGKKEAQPDEQSHPAGPVPI